MLFERFLRSDYSVFAVVGESGFGKTNFLCHLVTRRLGDGNLVLFYPGYNLGAGDRSVRSRIRGDLGLEESFEFLLIRLERVLPRGDKLFVLLDSVERCEDRSALASELDDLVQVIRGRPVRLIVTCRTFAWSGFATQPGGQMSMRSFATNVFPSSSRVQPEADVRDLGRPVDIEPFGPEEFAEAWNRYRRVYGLPADLNEDLIAELRQPLLLRTFCEVFDPAAPLPQKVSRFALFSKYVSKRIPDVEAREVARELAKRMAEHNEPRLPLDRVDMSTLQILVAASIGVIDDADGKAFVQFREEGVLEFLISERLVDQLRAVGPSGAVEQLAALAATRSPNVAAAAVEALATLGDNDALVAVCLEYLASLNNEWRYCCCAVLRALPRLSRAYDRLIHGIAEDRDFRLRRFLVDCVADRYSPEARRDLVNVFVGATDRWEFRETILILERDDAPGESLLAGFLDAGNAFHWRERRAAGYGLNRLWQRNRIGQRHRDAVVSGWHALSWRQKYALSIALLDNEASGPSATASALMGMAVDANPHVRWGIANYVTR